MNKLNKLILVLVVIAASCKATADFNIYMWASDGNDDGGPGYRYSGTIYNTPVGGFVGVNGNGEILIDGRNNSGAPSTYSGTGGKCGDGPGLTPCKMQF